MTTANFFVSYNTMEGRQFKPLDRHGGDRARKLVDQAVDRAIALAHY